LLFHGLVVDPGGRLGDQVSRDHLSLGQSDLLLARTDRAGLIAAHRLHQQAGGVADGFGADPLFDFFQAASVGDSRQMTGPVVSHRIPHLATSCSVEQFRTPCRPQ
jgi:hypothetical protein